MNFLKSTILKFYNSKKYSDLIPLAFLIIGFIFFSVITFQQSVVPIVDIGRELYLTWQTSQGQILYKDIFNVYGPLAYLFNAAFYTIYPNLNIFYILALLNTFFITLLTYFIANQFFFSKWTSFSLTALIMLFCGFNYTPFSFKLPYSYAMAYGLTLILACIFCLIKFTKQKDNIFLYMACFLLSLAILNKQDFIPFALLFIITLFVKKISFKEFIISILCFIIPITITFSYLFIQGLSVQDLNQTLHYIKTMSETNAIKHLYTLSGMRFKPILFLQSIIETIKFFIAVLIIYFMFSNFKNIQDKLSKNIFSIFSLALCFYTSLIAFKIDIFALLPFCVLTLIFLNIKKFKQNKTLLIIALSAIFISLKVFFYLQVSFYGSFALPLVLIAFVALFLNLFHSEEIKINIAKSFTVVFLILSSLNVLFIFQNRKFYNFKLTSKMGTMYTSQSLGKVLQKEISILQKNTKEDEKILVIPEGHIINFLTQRNTDNFYHSIMPVYTEMFGEQNIINHLANSKIQHIVLLNRNLDDYGVGYFGQIYGKEIYNFIKKNYLLNEIVILKQSDLKDNKHIYYMNTSIKDRRE